ncbi:MAG: Calx-beta domain-containing protein, partial [Cyanobacteriota bacterium]|nr:Calx-beta domain-containing protein [Cyanobacteriota bacterium]
NITVTRTGGSDGAVSAEVSLTGGTATAGADFGNIFPISVNFADGESGSKTVTIPIINDTVVEETETLNLALASLVGGAILGSQGTAMVEIVDNDVASPLSDPANFYYGLDEQELLLSSFDDAGGWELGATRVFNGELLAKPGANWAEAHYNLSAFDNLDLDNGDISLYWRARADRRKPEVAKFFVELNVLDNPIVDGHDEDREVKWSIRPVAPNHGNFNNLPYSLYLDPGWQIPHEVHEELQVPNEFVTPDTYENFRLSLSKTGSDTVEATPYHWANGAWQSFLPKSGSTVPMSLSIADNLAGRDFFESLTVRFRRDLSALDAFAITQTPNSSTVPSDTTTPRLFLDGTKIDELKAAIQVEGSHHQAAFQAMKARVDENDWRVYDENPNDGNYNYARSWLAREASLLYLLTEDTSYAQIAYNALYDVENNPDPDNRVPDSGYGLARAMVGMGFAIAYDWARAGWTQQQQDYVRSQITTALDAWPSYTHANLASPWGSNWVAVSRGAEVVMMLAAEEEVNRASRYETIKSQLQQHIETAYGQTGWTQEGNGYLAYSGGFLLPAVYALQSVGDTSLDATFEAVEFWQLPMYAGAFDDNQSSLQFGVGGTGFDNEGWTSLLLNATPTDQLSYYQYFYDRHRGIENAAPDEQKFDNRRAGTVWSLLYYPTATEPVNPTGIYAAGLADEGKGAYFFRNRWQDENDTLVSFMADSQWHPKGWDRGEAFSLGLFAYDTRFIGGPGKETAPSAFSTLLVNGAVGESRTTGNTEFFAATETGGYAIADGGTTYQGLGVDSAKRHFLTDFSGNAGTAILSTLDRLEDTDNNTYTWQLNLGDAYSDGGVSAIAGNEGGLSTFLLSGNNESYLKGWILHPTDATIVAGDPLQAIASGTNTDIWTVMVLGTGTAPVASVSGTGMDAVLELGNALISYDVATNRIVTAESPNAIYDVVGTAEADSLTGNAGANTFYGGLGDDLLTGGSGADVFVYAARDEGTDTIADFTVDDIVQISAAGFGGGLVSGVALSDGVASTTGTFVRGSAPVGTSGNFLYEGGVLSFDPDGVGTSGAIAIATFVGAPGLQASQLVIVP